MHFRPLLFPCILTAALLQACFPDSKNIGETATTDGDPTHGTEASTHSAGTDDPLPSTSVGTEGTTSTTADVTAAESVSTTSEQSAGESVSTTSEQSTEGTTSTTADESASHSTTSEGTTGPDPQFERFFLKQVSGLCPPDSDCDGFVELLSTRTLRVEKMGDLGNPVTEIQVDEDDYAAAVAVFADPALVEVLDSPEPLCVPPTDIFEQMELELDGTLHDATTTTCPQPPLQAARDAAEALRLKYVP
ncbi:hypothetical protein [Nannocystis punicea]|uniref:DUF3105 domain-containing protein n=1 Tax=Nannocystis punicea TaxID=2995304 RepID=A0ABY7GRV4_9BACT|nr:hypothetical protein [Nannocystis poenicansa]WAS89683.1 hypothetical protein O0S08_26110 [Nannocystis poenicansa]